MKVRLGILIKLVGVFLVMALIMSGIPLGAALADSGDCGKVYGSGGDYWYECNGVVVTQVADAFWGDSIADFQVIGERAVWKFCDGFSGGNYAYYSNSVQGGSITKITQEANVLYGDYIADFQVNEERAVWKYYDGSGTGSYAYYYNCITGGLITQITQKADMFWGDTISGFSVSGDEATWTYYSGFNGRTTSHLKVLETCIVNNPPVVSDVPDSTINEGDSFATINLDDYVTDPDNADSELAWTYSGNVELLVNIDVNRVATVSTPDPDWYGSETITFRATDPGLLWDEDAATFTVNEINETTLTYNGDTSVQYSDTIILSATLTDGAVGLYDKEISFTLCSLTTTAVTDADGYAMAHIKLDQPPGSYTVVTGFAGDADYLPSSDSDTFTIDKEDSIVTYNGYTSGQYSDTIILSATLEQYDTDFGDVDDKLIYFTIGSMTTTATTDADGYAMTHIELDQPSGSYTVVTGFAGDSYYLPSSDSDTFTINKEDSVISYEGYPGGMIYDTVTVSARLEQSDADFGDLSGKLISFTVGSQTVTAVTDASGYALTTMTINQPIGSYTILTEFAGDPYYLPCSDTYPFNVDVNPLVAHNDAYTTDEDTVLNVAAPGVLGNDEGADPALLTAIKVTDPSNGTVSLNADGSFAYTPNADFYGIDSFTYKMSYGSVESNIATVAITVNEVIDTIPIIMAAMSGDWYWQVVYSDPVTIILTVVDNTGESIQNQVEEPKVFYLEYHNGINWIEISQCILVSGVLTYTFEVEQFENMDVCSGDWPIRFRFDGDSQYEPAIQEGTLEVLPETPVFHDADHEPDTWQWEAAYSDMMTINVSLEDDDGENLYHQADQPKAVYLEYHDGGSWLELSQDALDDILNGNSLEYDFSVEMNSGYWPIRFRFDGDCRYGSIIQQGVLHVTNNPPVADAGGDYTDEEGCPITLDASNSYDPDGNTLLCRWDFDGDGTYDTDWLSSPFVVHAWTIGGYYPVSLEVTDGWLTSTDITTVTILGPEIDAGPDQTADEGQIVSFYPYFTGSEEVHTWTYEWDFGDGNTADTLVTTHFYAYGGTYYVTLTASDELDRHFVDSLVVTVLPPEIDAGPDQTVDAGQLVSFNPYFTGSQEVHTWTYQWDFGDGDTADTLVTTHIYIHSGTYTVTLTITDESDRQFIDTLVITVVNEPPVAYDQNVTTLEDTAVAITLDAFDADSATLYWEVNEPSHGTSSGTPPDLLYTPDADYNGVDSFTFKVNDGFDYSNVATVTIDVAPVNDTPSFTPGSDQIVDEDSGSQSCWWATAVSPGPYNEASQIMHFTVTNDNTGLFSEQPAISPDGLLTYTPAPDANGTATVTVRLHDDGGTENGGNDTSPALYFAITVVPANDPPAVSVIPDQTIDEGGSFAIIILDDYVDDLDNTDDEMTWTCSGNTDLIVSINASRVVTIAAPDTDWNGAETITFRATDPGALWNEYAATFTVNAVNDPPSAPVVDVTPETSFTIDILVCTVINPSADIDGDDITYTYEWYRNGELQTGLTTYSVSANNTSKGELWKCVVTPNDGTEDGPGAYDEVIIENSAPEAACKDITLELDASGQATLKPEDVDDGSSDPDNDPIELSLDRTEFGCADLGDNTITFTVTDDEGLTDSCQVTVTVVDVIPPDVSVTSPEDGKTYANTQGVIAVAYSVSEICDPEPDIVVTLDGQPFTGEGIDLGDLASGTHTLAVKATDDSGNEGESAVTFYVEPEALESFIINNMTINWAPEQTPPGGRSSGWMFNWRWNRIPRQDKFSISGWIQLPEGYTQEDLEASSTITVSIADGAGEGHDTLVFQRRPLGRSGAMWIYWGYANPPGDGMNITQMTIWFSPQAHKRTNLAWFTLNGVLEIPDIGNNTRPANATVSIEIPVTAGAGCGSLIGQETVTFNVSNRLNTWSYFMRGRL